MSNFQIINLQKKKIPTIYEYMEAFLIALKKRLNNESLSVLVELIKFEDTQANVLIDNTVVGMLSTYYQDIEQMKLKEIMETPNNVLLYFIPNLSFFSFLNSDDRGHFIKLSNDFMRAYVNTIQLDVPTSEQLFRNKACGDYHFPKNEIVDKSIDSFDIEISSSKTRFFYGSFMNRPISFIENSRLIFNLVKEQNSFKLIDDFKMSIKNREEPVFVVLGVDYASFHKSNSMFCVSLEKRDDVYKINHDYYKPIHNISFNEKENIPDMKAFVSIVCYYSFMKSKNMETPSFEHFLTNATEYKKLIEMTVF